MPIGKCCFGEKHGGQVCHFWAVYVNISKLCIEHEGNILTLLEVPKKLCAADCIGLLGPSLPARGFCSLVDGHDMAIMNKDILCSFLYRKRGH
jgi:hypothetical protein